MKPFFDKPKLTTEEIKSDFDKLNKRVDALDAKLNKSSENFYKKLNEIDESINEFLEQQLQLHFNVHKSAP